MPIPSPSSYVLSPIPSTIKSFQPSLESIRAEKVETAKRLLYKILTSEFFQKEGQEIVEGDDIYIAGKNDVRYKRGMGPEPNIQDPQYWINKISYFHGHYLTTVPVGERSTKRLIIAPSETTWRSSRSSHGSSILAPQRDSTPLLSLGEQHQAPTTRPLECPTAPVEDPMDKENCAPCSGIAVTQQRELPATSKRRRGSHSDDTDQAEDQLLHPSKRSKPEAEQASETHAAATRCSPKASSLKTPTGDATAPQPRALDLNLYHETGKSLTAPIVIEEPEDGVTRTPPQRRKRQRKTYEKERTSRRLAGKSPEFGLLPKRGEEPRPYEAPSRRVATDIGKMNSSVTRSGRISKKPAATKSAKSRADSKPAEEGTSRQKRRRRN
ncbi:hypothetical protein F4859DRAFT_252170 [Xylaria cf. heliscus]|nr:hypothetical protein F4859DRAFT_252170 [Xylaria cf. heliscus]